MLIAGTFGGIMNHCLAPSEEATRPNLLRSVTLGIGASFLVPLFLNMISSNLLEVIRGTTSVPGDPSKLLVFAGFCLVAAISSKAFIKTLSDRILQEARDAHRDAQDAKEAIAKVEAVVDPLLAKETESDSEGQIVEARAAGRELSPEDRVLHALIPERWTLRSLGGLAKDAGIDKAEANLILDALTARGLVGRRTGQNGPRWFLTEAGRRALSIS